MRTGGSISGMWLRAIAAGTALVLTHGLARADMTECFEASEKAQRLRTEKKLVQARASFMVCAKDGCPTAVRSDCAKSLSDVENGIATVVVHARDPEGHDITDVKVSLDGAILLSKLDGTAVEVDPGPHKLRYEFSNGKVVEESVVFAEGEKHRMLSVSFGDAPEEPKQTARKGAGPVPWIIGGVGLAALVGFALVEIPIQSQYSSLSSGCGKTQSCTQAEKDSVTSLYAPAAILLGVGIAGVGVSATWLIVSALTGGKKASGSFGIAPVASGVLAGYTRAF
jgi:hypothetical protein